MNRRKFLFTCASLQASLNLYANSFSPKIYLAPSLPSALLVNAAKKSDFTYGIWKNPDELKAGVISGKMQLFLSPANVCAMFKNKGVDVGYVNFLTTGVMSLISRKKPISDLGELVGKKVLLPFRNDMPDIVLKALLERLKIDEKKIQFIYTQTPFEAAALFLSKKDIFAAYLPEPAASKVMFSGEFYRGLNSSKLWQELFGFRLLQAGLAASKKTFAEFDLATLHQNTKLALSDAELSKDAAKLFRLEQNLIDEALKHSNLCCEKASDVMDEVLQFLHFLGSKKPALIGGKLPSKDIFLC